MLLSQLSTLLAGLIEALFPQKCLGCKRNGPELCTACMARVRRLDIGDMSDTIVPFPYQDPLIGKALRTLKYKNRKSIGRALGAALYEPILFRISEEASWEPGTQATWTVIPIPLSSKRHKKRGFNQSELIARGLIETAPDGIFTLEPELLERARDTESQVAQPSRTARFENVLNCFTVPHPPRVQGKRIILIDDTRTTGATLLEARNTLLHAGALRIVCSAVAQQE